MNDEAVHEGLCPATRAVFEIISRRWNGLIMQTLVHGELCFMEIERRIPGISGRLLSLRLRELEDKGIVGRRVESGRPVRVRYRLSPKGAELATVLEGLVAWAHRWNAGGTSDTADTAQDGASRDETPASPDTL